MIQKASFYLGMEDLDKKNMTVSTGQRLYSS